MFFFRPKKTVPEERVAIYALCRSSSDLGFEDDDNAFKNISLYGGHFTKRPPSSGPTYKGYPYFYLVFKVVVPASELIPSKYGDHKCALRNPGQFYSHEIIESVQIMDSDGGKKSRTVINRKQHTPLSCCEKTQGNINYAWGELQALIPCI